METKAAEELHLVLKAQSRANRKRAHARGSKAEAQAQPIARASDRFTKLAG